MALARGRGEAVQPVELVDGQFQLVGGCILLDTGNPFGTGNGRYVIALRQQPGQRNLGRCGI